MDLIGISKEDVRTSSQGPAFRLGTLAKYDDPDDGTQMFVYVKAVEAITGRGYACIINGDFEAEMADTTSSAPGAGVGCRVGVAHAAIALNGFGWLQVYGKGPLLTGASAAVGTMLNTTATPGQLDDDGTSGAESIFGVTLGTATGAQAEVNEDAYFNFPFVGTTLP